MHTTLWYHPRLEQLHITVLVPGHLTVLGWLGDVQLSLPLAEDLQGRIGHHRTGHAVPLGPSFHHLGDSHIKTRVVQII